MTMTDRLDEQHIMVTPKVRIHIIMYALHKSPTCHSILTPT